MTDDWWRTAVLYQVYPRSFADANGDGVGDLPGVTGRLQALAELGVDAVWLSPFYPSPQVDAGYDIADHCDVDPLFGTLADADALVARAHELGLRVVVDLVPNHTSSAHPWFAAALAAGPGSAERERYVFRDEPTDWGSVFGGSAWTQVPDGQWYLHLFDPTQPDLNWRSAAVRDAFDAILRFWLDRGVDGFRVDVGHALIKDESFPSYPDPPLSLAAKANAPYWDREGVHEIYRRWRALLDGYVATTPDRPRVLCGEVNQPVDRAVRYVRPDEMHQVFNFAYLNTPWRPGPLRSVIDASLAAYGQVGAPATWVLSNHDVVRAASRFGYPDDRPAPRSGIGPSSPQPDQALGLRRARAAALLMLALPGSAYLYQGEELGLPEHTTLPDDARQDPTFARTGGAEIGRDGCRVPLPWTADAPHLGFGSGAPPWLPQPAGYRALARDRQAAEPGSTLSLYAAALRLRRELGLGTGALTWHSEPGSAVLDLARDGLRVTANLGAEPVPLPDETEVLLRSDSGRSNQVPVDVTVWWRAPVR